MMLKNYIFTAFFAAVAFAANAQCPGPSQRTALLNLQRANEVNGTRAFQFVMTDTCGNQRYVTLDSVLVLIVDSIGADTALQWNWYTTNGVTTSLGRTAYVKRTAQWIGLDTLGFLRHRVRPDGFDGSQSTVYNDSLILEYANAIAILNRVTLADTGIIISTQGDEARSVNILTDTVNWSSSFDPTLQIHNLLPDGTYFVADSLKTVAIGQFPSFPTLNEDGAEKGFFYNPAGGSVAAYNGNGTTGEKAQFFLYPEAIEAKSIDGTGDLLGDIFLYYTSFSATLSNANGSAAHSSTLSETQGESELFTGFGNGQSSIIKAEYATDDLKKYAALHREVDNGDYFTTVYLGTYNGQNLEFFSLTEGFGVQTSFLNISPKYYNWMRVELEGGDTTINAISFYDSSYLWVNAAPSPILADTSFHFWAGNGTDTDPGFMTLEQIRGADAPNIYNSNGQQTDNTRIDTIKQTIEFTRLNTGSSFEPGFKVSARAGNRPSAQGWYFNSNADSILIYKTGSNVAYLESASMPFGFTATSDYIFFDGDSIRINFGALSSADEGDILVVTGIDASDRTVKIIEGTYNADVLSWSAGGAGDKWEVVPANRTTIGNTGASITYIDPATQETLIDGVGGGTVAMNFTPSVPSTTYTTYRHIYNTSPANTTVSTDQSWQFEDQSGDLGTSFTLPPRTVATLLWIYSATPANARFFVVRTALAVNQFATLRPAQLTATTNNWNPTGFSTYSNQTIIFSGDGNFQTVTGLTAATRDGVTKTFRNDGTNCVVFAKQHTSSSSGNRFDFTRDLVFLPQMEATLKYDSVGADWTLVSTTYDHVSFGNIIETDLRSNSGLFDDPFWDYNAFGGTSNKSIASSASLPLRYFSLSTSTAATAYPTITSYTGEIYQRANGSYLRQYAKVRLEDLSAAAEDFDIRWGWTNGTIDTNTVEGAWISYQREENSGGWTLKTNNGATTTTTNCGAAIAADTWYDIEIIYYPYGEVTVFIDGTRYTTTSTLPDAITTTPLLQIDKDNGTTARILYYSAAELTYVNVSD